MRYGDLARRYGFFLPDHRATVWLVGGPREIECAYGVVDEALRLRPGFKLIIAAPPASVEHTRRRFPHEVILPYPASLGIERWLKRLHPVLVVLGDDGLVGCTVPSVSIAGLTACRIVERLPPQTPGVEPRQLHPIASFLVRMAAGGAIERLSDLSRRLGGPEEILCLGNGPSSEDQRLEQVSFDCLFRVNWIWRDRGLLASPHMVFTADPDPPTGSTLLAFPNKSLGLPILWRHCARLNALRRGHVFADRLLPSLRTPNLARLPSNGAIMIATATALAPRRIIIAGIDLYEHVEGRYPGDKEAIDGYSRDHDRDIDVAFIRMALASYRGEVSILSERLREAIRPGAAR